MRPRWLVLLVLFASGAIVMAQNKPVKTISSSKPATASTRVPPTIKCIDPESAVACKSFKQLIDARDSGVLFGIIGDPEDAGRHFAYACPRRGTDNFAIVEFTVPEKKKFKPFISMGDDDFRRVIAGAMLGQDPAHPLSLSAVNQWSQDHRDGLLFAHGAVALASYQDGELEDLKIEDGEWSRSARVTGTAQEGSYASFDGGNYWVQSYNEIHAGESPEADDPKNLHLHINGRAIYVHYSYKTRAENTVDYTLQIHLSTGRFTEIFKLPDDRTDLTGTCMIFKY